MSSRSSCHTRHEINSSCDALEIRVDLSKQTEPRRLSLLTGRTWCYRLFKLPGKQVMRFGVMLSQGRFGVIGQTRGHSLVVPIVIKEMSSSSVRSSPLSDQSNHKKQPRTGSNRYNNTSQNTLSECDGRPHRRSRNRNNGRFCHVTSSKEGNRTREKRNASNNHEERVDHHHRHHRRSSRRGNQRNRCLSEAEAGNRKPSSTPSINNHKLQYSSCRGTTTCSKTVNVEQDVVVSEPPKEVRRRRIAYAVVLTALGILISSVLLVAIMLLVTPSGDDELRKENEEILRGTSSTSSPAVNGATVNKTFNFTGQPG